MPMSPVPPPTATQAALSAYAEAMGDILVVLVRENAVQAVAVRALIGAEAVQTRDSEVRALLRALHVRIGSVET